MSESGDREKQFDEILSLVIWNDIRDEGIMPKFCREPASLIVVLALITIGTASAEEDWKPARPRLMTEWGEKVSPDNAWREYPRPQFVRERWQNLNGLWDYAVAKRTEPPPTKFAGKILVPFALESALSGVGRPFGPEDRLWYRRTFAVPRDWDGRRVLLHFGAVDCECTLWVNGALVGSHIGGSDPFTFDITPFLRDRSGAGGDAPDELLLAVTDPTDTGEQPRGKQQLDPRGIWYTPVSGIWQTVWMEPVPEPVSLRELRLTPDLEAGRPPGRPPGDAGGGGGPPPGAR